MKILLVMPPNWGVEMPPLGISYVAAALKQDHHTVSVVDYNLKIWHQLKTKIPLAWAMSSYEKWTQEAHYDAELADKIDPLFVELLEDVEREKPDVIGFSVFATSIFPVERVTRLLRTRFPHIKTIFGGPNVREEYARHVVLQGLADAAIIGEGEGTVCEVLKSWESGALVSIPGAILPHLVPGRLIEGMPRAALEINALPNPDFTAYPLEHYISRSLPFSMSRGCIKRCTFCAEAPFWKRYRTRSAESIFEELRQGVEKYGVTNFLSHDSLMNGDFEVLEKLVDMLNAAKLGISWQGMCRLDKRMTPVLLEKMRQAGCTSISYGLETGSQKVADLMKKGVRIDDALQVIMDSYDAGISVNVFIIVGFPGESWIDYIKTMIFLFKVRRKIFLANVSDAGISKGAPLQLRQRKFGIVEGSTFAGEWHDKYYFNTIYHRRFKLWLMRKFISSLRVNENKLSAPLETLFETA